MKICKAEILHILLYANTSISRYLLNSLNSDLSLFLLVSWIEIGYIQIICLWDSIFSLFASWLLILYFCDLN